MRRALPVVLLSFAVLLPAHGNEVRYTSVKALDETISKLLPHEERFAVTGQVISIFLRDGLRTISLTDGETTMTATDKSGTLHYGYGDIARATGTVIRNPKLGKNGITVHALEVIGHAPLPKTTPLDLDRLYTGHLSEQGFKNIKGVITSVRHDDLDVHWNWLTLRVANQYIPVALKEDEYRFSQLTALVDAEVEFRGQISGIHNILSKKYLLPFGTNGYTIVRPPGDPFTAPPLGQGDPCHRQTIKGVVKAISANRIFMHMDSPVVDPSHFISVSLGESRNDIHPGDIVTASGFQDTTSANRHLSGAVVRHDGHKDMPEEPVKEIKIEDLFTSPLGLWQVRPEYHGTLIRVTGTVITTSAESHNTGVMRLRKKDMTVEIQVADIDATGYETIEEGCLVSATGFCIVELEDTDAATVLPVHKRTFILPRSASDIRVLVRPPWWTPQRLIVVIALLCAMLVGAMTWNKVLKKRAVKYGEALFRERIAHAEAEVKVEVRTRLAVELHDSISQSLTGIALQVDSAERANAGSNQTVASFLRLARQMLGSCRRELQSCLLDLRKRTFEEKDLSEAIRLTVLPLSENSEISVRFNVPREGLAETTVHTILKIIRELVVNAIRHGGATHVRIAGEREGAMIRFSVRDNGCGFDSQSAPGPAQGHFGIQGIRERTKEFNGTVTIESSIGQGTKVTVTMNMTRED